MQFRIKVDEVATAVEEIGNSMTLTLKALAEGKQDIEHTASEVEASVDNGTEVTEKLENLNQYMDEMNSIVELIGGITNQTSLLALNASIRSNPCRRNREEDFLSLQQKFPVWQREPKKQPYILQS